MALSANRELLLALLEGAALTTAVPMTLEILEQDPLATAGCFPGDLLRGLMEVTNRFWASHLRLHERYRQAVRAGARARQAMPREERMEFWSVLDIATVERTRYRLQGAVATVAAQK